MSARSHRLLSAAVALFAAAAQEPDGAPHAAVRGLEAAPGLAVSLWAGPDLVANPTSIDVDERGRVWVAEAVNYRGFRNREEGRAWRDAGDRISIVEDSDGDGVADRAKVFVQEPELVAPLGVAVIGDKVVVSCSPNLVVYTRGAGDEVLGREVLLTGFGGFDHDHSLHAVELLPDGRWLFNAGNAGPHVVTDRSGWTLRSGSWYAGDSPYNRENTPGLVSDDGRVWHGGLALAVHPDGTGLEVLGHGFRNAVGTCADSFGELWMNDNDDTRSCRTTWLLRHGDCGYDSKDGARAWQADRRPGQSVPAAHWRQDDPGVIPSGHVYGNGAPAGIAYYESDALGEAYAGGLLLSCDAGRNVVWGYRRNARGAGYALDPFVFVGSSVAPDDDYVWHERPSDPARWFRPSDVAIDTDGSVLVADWFDPVVGGHQMDDRRAAGAILRVAPAGRALSRPDLADGESVAGLVRRLRSPVPNVRNAAIAPLAAKGERALPILRMILEGAGDRFARARAAWVLARMGEAGRSGRISLTRNADPELRVVGWRARRAAGEDVLAGAAERAGDESPAVRRELALDLRDVPFAAKREPLVELARRLRTRDRWALEAFGTACEGVEDEAYALLREELGGPALEWSRSFAQIVWRLHPEDAVPALRERALSADLPRPARRVALDTLAFVPARAAGEAMLAAATEGPKDLRGHARWWVEHRSTHDWSAYELAARLPSLYPTPPRFASGAVHGGSIEVEVDVQGARTLWLVADDAGDGNADDRVDWLDPVLAGLGGTVRLEELPWTRATTARGAVHRGRSIGAHAPAEIAVDLSGVDATRFTVRCAVGGGGPAGGASPSVRFFLYHDGPSDAERVRALRAVVEDEGAEMAERERAVRALARIGSGGSALLSLASGGALPPALLAAATEGLRRNPDLAVRALAEAHLGRAAEPRSAGDTAHEVLALEGDAGRGRAVFFDASAACSRCHSVDGQGGGAGPDLSRIGAKYGRPELLRAILEPSAAILTGYEAWLVEVEDGRTLAGRIVAEGETLAVMDSQARVRDPGSRQGRAPSVADSPR